jgi:hypothetical protein
MTANNQQENTMKRIIAIVMTMCVAVPPGAWASQKDVSPAMEAAAFKQLAVAIPPGSRVRVETRAGRRLTATLMSVSDEGVVLKRDTRVPEPAVALRFDELSALRRHEPRGMAFAKMLGIGLAAGAGAMLTLFLIFLSVED